MKAKIILATAALALGTAIYFTVKNKDKKDAKKENKTSEDINDYETEQAIKLKNLLGVSQNLGTWTTNGEIITAATKANIKVLNIMLSVVNWSKLQQKFMSLCANEFTLLQALTKALYDDDFDRAIQYAKAKKVVTTKEVTTPTVNFTNTVSFAPNTVIGAYDGDTITIVGYKAYTVINQVTDDGQVKKIICPVDSAKIVTP